MARYPTGQPVRLSTTVRDVAGVLANAGALTLTVLKPDLTTQSYGSPTNDGTGLYHQDIPTADIAATGHYQYKWVATGSNAGVSSGALEVYDPFDSELLSVEDGKQHLNIPSTTTTYDAELEGYVAAVTDAVEGIVGPVGRRTVTETVYPSSGVLLLGQSPVISLTSVTPYASTALSLGTLSTDVSYGIVRPLYGSPGLWASSYTVVYVAGRTAVPAAVSLAARIILGHLWETQRGGTTSPQIIGADTAELTPFGLGFALPNRALELLAPYRRAPAVA